MNRPEPARSRVRTGPSLDFEPWRYPADGTAADRARVRVVTDALAAGGATLADDVFVSQLAVVEAPGLAIGPRSYIAAHAHVGGIIGIGADCSVNVGTVVRGRVTLGDGVRIGTGTAILGFDHGIARTDIPVREQPLTSAGITIGDDVWIGAHVSIVDGVTVGDHAVIGAGAVVTRDVPPWAVAAGSPAHVIRDRRHPRAGGRPATQERASAMARDLGQWARRDATALLHRSWDGEHFRNAPGSPPTVRAHTDAVELAMLVHGRAPGQMSPEDHVARLQGWQDVETGLVPQLGAPLERPRDDDLPSQAAAYHVLCVGYALDLLGSAFEAPVASIVDLPIPTLVENLDGFDWGQHAWGAGAMLDAVGTALAWARAAEPSRERGAEEAVLGWMAAHRDGQTGLWGDVSQGWREPINGTYRALRGTAGVWGIPRTADPALAASAARRARDLDWEAVGACDVLDVVHLAWWSRMADADRDTAVRIAAAALETAVRRWDGGLAFAGDGPVSLQGTEMWLATAWYASALLGVEEALGFEPAGIHRPGATTALV